MSTYPSTYDLSLPAPVDNVTEALADQGNAWSDAIYNLEHAVGLSGDTASSTGTIYAKIAYLLASGGGIFKQTTAPSSPATDALWLDTDDPDCPLYDFRSSAWTLLGTNAINIRGVAIDTASPANGQVLTYNSGTAKAAWAAATGGMTDPETSIGDLIYRNGSNVTDRLGIGSAGQFLGVSAGLPAWLTPAYVPAPGTPQQGDVLYYDGTTWTRLGAGTTGKFLKTLGPSANPMWDTPPSAAPGDGIPAPAGQAQGDILYFDGVDWVSLHAGTSGLFLKTNGTGANPAWAAPSTGMANVLTTTGDLIYSSSGSTAARLGIGSTGQGLVVSGGAPAWGTVNPLTTQDDLFIGGASGVPARLAKGSDGQVLQVSASTHHLVWANNPAGFSDPTTTRGDLLYHGVSGTTRLGIGSSGYVLTSDGTDAAWAVLPTDTDYYQTVQHGGSAATQRPTVNLIDGNGIALTVADNSGSSRTDVTITARWSRALAFA